MTIREPPNADGGGWTVATSSIPTWPEPAGEAVDRFARSESATAVHVPGHPEWETGAHQKEEEFARAVPLALFDYLRKSRAQRLCRVAQRRGRFVGRGGAGSS